MGLLAIALVLCAAVLHATWNAMAKRSGDPLAFLWTAIFVSLAVYAVPFVVLLIREPLTRAGLLFIVLSALFHAAYYVMLARAYQRTDLSLAYPVARGTGMMLVPLLAMPIFGIYPTPLAWAGIVAVAAGVVWLHAPAIAAARQQAGGMVALLTGPATLTGLTITAYSLNDAAGVQHTDPVVYLYLTFVLVALILAPVMLGQRRDLVRAAFADRRSLLIGGIGIFGTYALILLAMQLAPVSYVVPMRELSIVIGALIGMRYLGEAPDARRLAACGTVAAGVIAIGLGG